MDLLNITSKDISAIKVARDRLPNYEAMLSEWNPQKHKTIIDQNFLPNKKIEKATGIYDSNGDEVMNTTYQDVNRIALSLQKLIVNKSVSFTFGNEPQLHCDVEEGSEQEKIYEAVVKLNKDNKIKSFNRDIYRDLLRFTEVAEYWYLIPTENDNEVYGIKTKSKIKVAKLSPAKGDELYPVFDETGDMIAFGRGYKLKEKEYFEVWTKDKFYRFINEEGEYRLVEGFPMKNELAKIPVVYMKQESVEWADVQNLIDRLELFLSRFGDINDYNAAPTTFVKGELVSMPAKGESGKVLQSTSEDGDVKILSWDNAPESIKLEIDTLIRFIYSLTQTPDISFDSVKGMGNVSGVALDMLFMDAYLKVEEKKEILDDYLQRRTNIQKSFFGHILGKRIVSDSLFIEPEIIPFKINDTSMLFTNIQTATSGGFMSKKTAIKNAGWAEDVNEELDLIEAEQAKTKSIFGSGFEE